MECAGAQKWPFVSLATLSNGHRGMVRHRAASAAEPARLFAFEHEIGQDQRRRVTPREESHSALYNPVWCCGLAAAAGKGGKRVGLSSDAGVRMIGSRPRPRLARLSVRWVIR